MISIILQKTYCRSTMIQYPTNAQLSIVPPQLLVTVLSHVEKPNLDLVRYEDGDSQSVMLVWLWQSENLLIALKDLLNREDSVVITDNVLELVYCRQKEIYEGLWGGVSDTISCKFIDYYIKKTPSPGPSLSNFMLNTIIPHYISSPSPHLNNTLKHYLQLLLTTHQTPQIHTLITKYQHHLLHRINTSKITASECFPLLKVMEMLHVHGQKKVSIAQVLSLMYECMCDFDTVGANSLAINLYGEALKDKAAFTPYVEKFVDLYGVLDGYGSHLVKDVWHNFDYLCANAQNQPTTILPPAKLLHCLLLKVQHHKNINVIKYCIQSLLTSSQSSSLLQWVPDIIYGSLMQILNDGIHYHDAVQFHQHSKISTYIEQFHLKFYSTINEKQLSSHLKQLIRGMSKHVRFQHCLVGYMAVLGVQGGELDREDVERVEEVVRGVYGRFLLRRRRILVRAFCHVIRKVSSPTIEWVLHLVSRLHPDALLQSEVKAIFPHLFTQQALQSYIQQHLHSQKHINSLILLQGLLESSIPSPTPLNALCNSIDELSSPYQIQQLSRYTSILDSIRNLNKVYPSATLPPNTIDNILYIISIVLGKQASLPAQTLDDIERCIQVVCTHMKLVDKYNKQIAKFVEFVVGKVRQGCYVDVLVWVIKYKLQHTETYHAIEDVLYTLYEQLPTLTLSPLYSLRLQVLLFCVLSNDPKFLHNNLPLRMSIDHLQDISSRYDFQHYEQLYAYITVIFKHGYHHQNNPSNYTSELCEMLSNILDNMLHCLDYGVGRKEVIATVRCVVEVGKVCKWVGVEDIVGKLLRIGESYWGFQRELVFALVGQPLCEGLVGTYMRLVGVEQYRGQDSSIMLPQHKSHPIYSTLHPTSDYDGTTLRFTTLSYLHQQTTNPQSNPTLLKIITKSLQICLKDIQKQKMFLTGTHKHKLKLYQLLLCLVDFIIIHYHNLDNMVLQCIQAISHNNLLEVRYYAELFLMKLLGSGKVDLSKVVELLGVKLGEVVSQGSLGKNISYMVIGGLVLKKHYSPQLYSQMLTFICSHVAYYRGLTQYFCFTVDPLPLETFPLLQPLHTNYLNDTDTQTLCSYIHQILQSYLQLITTWQPQTHLFNQQPTLNGQVISSNYYVDEFKKLGQKIVKQKNQDGFMPLRDIWKNYDTHHSTHEMIETQTTFQRKIDPSLDDVYHLSGTAQHRASQLVILVVSEKKITLYGHLARVSEIMGVAELCIPSLQIIGEDQFKNVSCTAEKWLNITQNSNKSQNKKGKGKKKWTINPQQINDRIQKLLFLQYQPYLITKQVSIPTPSIPTHPKTLLIIDQLQLLDPTFQKLCSPVCNGPHYSTHVQASMFIWEYFKAFMI